MPHIHTAPGQIDHTVTAYIVRVDGDEPRALLHMHKKLGKLLPVGGHIELDETPWAAVAHEIEEEAGYRLEDLQVQQPHQRLINIPGVVVHPSPVFMNTHPSTADHYHSDTAYLFVARSGPMQALGDGESMDLRWLNRDELQRLDGALIWENTKLVYEACFDYFLHEWTAVDAVRYATRTSV